MIHLLKNYTSMVLKIVRLWYHNIPEGEEQFVVIERETLTTQDHNWSFTRFGFRSTTFSHLYILMI